MDKQVSKQNKFSASKKLMLTSIILGSVCLVLAVLALLALIYRWKIDDDDYSNIVNDFEFFPWFALAAGSIALIYVIILIISTILLPKDIQIKNKLTSKKIKIINLSFIGLILIGAIIFLVWPITSKENFAAIGIIIVAIGVIFSYVWIIVLYSFINKTKH